MTKPDLVLWHGAAVWLSVVPQFVNPVLGVLACHPLQLFIIWWFSFVFAFV